MSLASMHCLPYGIKILLGILLCLSNVVCALLFAGKLLTPPVVRLDETSRTQLLLAKAPRHVCASRSR